MIQANINNQTTTAFAYSVLFYLNLADKFVGTPTFAATVVGDDTYYAITFPYFLIKLKSQQTGKQKLFTRTGIKPSVGVNLNKYKRQITLSFKYSVNPSSTEDLSAGEILVGNDQFPLGFYDITIYETETDGELNPDNAKATLYNGILNMTASTIDAAKNFEEVQYTEYTTNDSENESVYLTN
jgi:hypothetical protein|tara:strand:+ start:125 stop:673 length:549 start_codon:yes stop_codon:yes gene_type:complete